MKKLALALSLVPVAALAQTAQHDTVPPLPEVQVLGQMVMEDTQTIAGLRVQVETLKRQIADMQKTVVKKDDVPAK